MSQLSDLLDPAAILLDASAEDWREAIRLSGNLLVSTGAIGPSYTDAMIRTVEEHGPYIVITPGFALAHSRPDDSVRRTAMSFVRLAEPLSFGHEANDPVTLVMALAAADSSAHQAALAALAGVLADPESRSALDSAASAQEVLAVLGAGDAPAAAPDAASTHAGSGDAGSGDAGSGDAGSGDVDSDAAGPVAAGTGLGVVGSEAARSDGADPVPAAGAPEPTDPDTVPSKKLILTVCGNGLGTSLFLKNTAEQVLDRWGWSSYLDIEATDTISAKGKAKDADVILTSGAIAETLGEVGVPVEIIENFTSQAEIDAVLRRIYAI